MATCHLHGENIWLVERHGPNKYHLVGGIPTPLKNMKVSWEYYSQYMEKHVLNHQPVMVRIVRIMMITPNIGWQMLMMLVVSTSISTALLSLWRWKLVGFICFNSRMSSQQQTQEMNGGGHLNSQGTTKRCKSCAKPSTSFSVAIRVWAMWMWSWPRCNIPRLSIRQITSWMGRVTIFMRKKNTKHVANLTILVTIKTMIPYGPYITINISRPEDVSYNQHMIITIV